MVGVTLSGVEDGGREAEAELRGELKGGCSGANGGRSCI